ncbi:MAG: sodium-dependent bicarbonate transport family permease [Polaromonas sp.]|nr:sodium-dependent bicarbonate transport family permease [Polaromonas sp.]
MNSLLDPVVMFFLLGIAAGALKSNLEIPQAISRFLSLYLMMALGLKGGFALAKSGLTPDIAISLACAFGLAVLVPLAAYALLRRHLNGYDAAAVSATYGSVSAVTFITAAQYLDARNIEYGGHMAAAMALMESPAIIAAIVLANLQRKRDAGSAVVQGLAPAPSPSLWAVIKDSLTDGTPLLLLGAMLIGITSGEAGQKSFEPFTADLFKGMLAFFLLDMGLLVSRNVGGLRGKSLFVPLYAVAGPVSHAGVALLLGWLTGMSQGNTILLMVLAGSASYIAVPAVVRHAIPEANPTLYFGMSLGITFPLNILVGIPVYTRLVGALW